MDMSEAYKHSVRKTLCIKNVTASSIFILFILNQFLQKHILLQNIQFILAICLAYISGTRIRYEPDSNVS